MPAAIVQVKSDRPDTSVRDAEVSQITGETTLIYA